MTPWQKNTILVAQLVLIATIQLKTFSPTSVFVDYSKALIP
ncbi:hypothetical protein C723_3162 [Christiangramia flava JLT2011]|nr:hypothetical protein C723_3162 [Christiangramia flava JLT2011]